ncbi:MAG: glycerol kinase GlpK [Proteobacteria bacterium]|nr:glycerol kinase GlpK [Pseudomonadota bacterium]
MGKHIIAIDQGTTQTTVLVLSEQLEIQAKASVEFPQVFPATGWVEHNPEAIWKSVADALQAALAKAGITGSDIAGIGITNQRETSIIWERHTGRPIYNAIVWQCRRTAGLCKRLEQGGHADIIRNRTGLVLDPYFSGTKIQWLLDNVQDARKQAGTSKLCFGTVDSYLVWKLTDGTSHVTDLTNASRTLLCDIHNGRWDDDLLKIFDIPRELLPSIVNSAEIIGETRNVQGLPDGIPIAGIAGDQQAALFGQACFERGSAKCTYGTGAFLMMNLGNEPVISNNNLLTTVAWKLNNNITYALEGSLFVAGAAVQWLRDGLGIIEQVSEIEELATRVPDSGGVVFVPALTGLAAPHWRPQARGLISGLTRSTTKAHIARACLDGIALQVADLIDAMQKDTGQAIALLKVDGGASANDFLMQLQADFLSIPLSRPTSLETTAIGAAFLAGLATGVWKDQQDIASAWREQRRFEPGASKLEIATIRESWDNALKKA